MAWQGVEKHRILCGRRGRGGSLSWKESVCVYGHRRDAQDATAFDPGGRGRGPAWELRTWKLRLRPLVLLVPEGTFTLERKPR